MTELSAGLRAGVALERYGFRTSHTLGQNFILDDTFLSRLLDLSGLSDSDRVLEIGPGPGVMTRLIAERAEKILAVEADEKLSGVLLDVLEGCANAEVVFADALKADLPTLVREKLGGRYRVIANLPYYITADLILKLFSILPLPESVCVMVQKEAADRLMSMPGDKNWCALAATVRFFADCEILEKVPPERFNPPPHVDSCFIRLDVRESRLVPEEEEQAFLKLIRCCFQMRRKTLANNLKSVYGMQQADAVSVLGAAGLPAQVRGEVLTLEQIAELMRQIQRVRQTT